MQMTSWVQRTKAMAVVLGTMLGVTAAQATLHSPETNPATDYRDGYTANVVPKSSSVLLYANAQLSKVVGVKGDFFFLHTNFSLPYFAECEWSIIAGVETNDGLFHYHYENTGTEEYALCQFQSRFRGSYLFVVTLKLTQVGNAIYAQVVGATYPWNEKYGDDHEATTFGVTYFENLDEIAGSSGGMTRASLSNVSLIFADGGATCNVTFEDLDGNVLSTQEVGYGEAATPPTNVPAVEGYVLAGWDGNYTAIQKDTVFKPVYHKLCTVTFQDPDGAQIGDAQLVEETKGATPPDMTGRSYDGAPFYKWNGDASVISADTTFTAIYKRIPVWTTGSYVPADWTPAAKNIMPNATVSNNGLTYYTNEPARTDNNPENLTNGAIPPAKGNFVGIVGIKSGSLEWTLDQPYYIDHLNVYTIWEGGGRDGIAIDQVLCKTETTGDEWIEIAGPIDGNTVSYGLNDDNSFGALFATLANTDGVAFVEKATALKIVFASKQDHDGAGYVEIEATGLSQAEIDGGALVSFVDHDGTVLKQGIVSYGGAAIPPSAPVRSGYKFLGWDTDFSYVTIALTVKARYHKWCAVTFKDADGTTINSQTIEETFAATAPDMTGRTYQNDPFLCWDGDPSVISDDVVFTAVYGVLPDYVDDVIATGTVPAGALIWAGGASGVWDTTSRKWATSAGALTTWTDGSVAVFPVESEIELDAERTASGMQIYDGDVTLSGDAITMVAPAKITHQGAGTLRFENDVEGEDGVILMTVRAPNYLSLGEENAVKLYSDCSLADIDTSALQAVLHYSRSGAAEKVVGAGFMADNTSKTGINYFKSGDGWMSFECRAILSDWYNNPYIVKVVLKEVGSDIYGYIEKAEGLESISNASSIEVTGGSHRTISIETAPLAAVSGAATHRMAVEAIILTDRDPLWNATTEIAGDYAATGWLAVSNGVFKVVDSGTLGGGTMKAPVFLADGTVYEYASDVQQTFKGPINMTSRGGGTSTTGRFVIAPDTYVTINCSAEYEERIFVRTDIYGYAYVNDGNYHDFYNNANGIYVHDGGTMSLGSGYGVYGHRNWVMIVEKGGTIIYRNKQNAGLAESGTQVLGGEIQFPTDYSANPQDNFFTKLIMQDGARLTGKMYTWAYGAYTHEIGGTSPSYIDVEKIRIGRTGDCNQWKDYTVSSGAKCTETLNVTNVTGDAAADLVVSSEIYANPYTKFTNATAQYFGVVKKGDGTVKFTGVSTNFNASLTLEAGSVAFGPKAKLNASALFLTGDGALEFERGATVAFGDSSAFNWTEGKKLNIVGLQSNHALRFGTDENGLTAAQLAAITINGRTAKVYLDANGYLQAPFATVLLFR